MKTYQLIPIDLTTAGSKTVNFECDRIHFVKALNAGVVDLDALINVKLSEDNTADLIPLSVNNGIEGFTQRFVVTWAAQSGTIAYLFCSNAQYRVTSPPTKQIVTSSIGSTLAQAAVAVADSAAVLLAAASGTRQSVTIQNLGTSEIFIGNNAVVPADGLKVAANGSFTLDKTTAALYAICDTGGTADVRVLIES